jgi:MATE family multidrug resistance protein
MNKRIFKLAIPNIISNITIPLLGMVDTALMGHMDSLIYVGAIALGSMIFNFLYWGLGFLRMGTLGFTGQANGAGDSKEVSRVLYRSIILAVVGASVLLIFHPFIIDIGLSFTNSSEAIKVEARNYFMLRIWALPASLIILSLSGWFIGMQNTVFPMVISIFSNISNILLSFLFVFNLNMQTEGVALGTVIAQYMALILAVGLWLYRYKTYIINIVWRELINSKLKDLLNVNKDIFIRTLGIIFVFSFFTIESANIDDTTLAVNTVLFQFFIFFSYMLDGFANAGEALSSEAIGAKSKTLLKNIIYRTLLFGLIFSLLFTVVYYFAGEAILQIITDNTAILNAAKPLLYWVILVPLISFPAFIFDGIFIGATASKAMRNTMMMATILVFVPIVYSGIGAPISRLWIGFLMFMFARGLFLLLSIKKSVFGKIA